uniref:Solute carrier family 2, facilitated glucose transporter member 5 n=1 Tax=Spermophilus dauricus TaxID=99837 RepID=A0A8C9QGZ6_SPEDA
LFQVFCCSNGKLTQVLNKTNIIAAFGSAFQYGYNIAVVNTPHQSFYNETYFERHGTFMDEKVLLLLWSCTVSMFPLGGLLGSLVVGLLVDRCGRKGTLLINNIFAILPAILMGVSKVAQAFELIIFSRVLVGVCAGISYSALPMYLGELAPKNLRGTLGTMTEVFVIIGIFLAQIFSLQAVLGNPTGWPVLLALTGVPALRQLLSLPFFPESPRYTLIQRGDEETARVTVRVTGSELEPREREERAGGRLPVLNLFTFRALRWQLITILVLMAGQQLSGINAINYYADTIYVSAGVEPAHSQYITLGSGLVNIVMTIISVIIENRNPSCLISCLFKSTARLSSQSTVPELSYLSVICIFAYIAGHSIGPSEYLKLPFYSEGLSRPAPLPLHLLRLLDLSVQEAIGAYSFLVFAGLCLLTAVYTYVVIPETKGRTFVEINHIFAKRNGVEIPEIKEEVTEVGPHIPSVPAKETTL